VRGDTAREVLAYVEFNAEELLNVMRRSVERAVKMKRLTLEESTQMLRFYEAGLSGYTYLGDNG
jgi:arginine decarboxylase